MFDELYQLAQEQLKHVANNQFATGGLIIGLAGGIALYLRRLPYQIMKGGKRLTSIDVEIRSSDDFFKYVQSWFNDKNPCVFSKDFILKKKGANSHLEMGMSKHWLFFERTLVCVERSIDREIKLDRRDPLEYLNFTFYTRRKGKILRFFQNILNEYNKDFPHIKVYTDDDSWWNQSVKIKINKSDSIIFSDGKMEFLRRDIQQFFNSREWYEEMDVPYKRGYLLSGPPGTGKTSTIKKLAMHFEANLYVINNVKYLNRRSLVSLISEVSPGDFIVVEDIDAMLTSRMIDRQAADNPEDGEEEDKKNIGDLSALLNALDGIANGEGYVLFMTTNHIHKLDPALIRPGRIDQIIEYKYLDAEQAAGMFLKFYPDMDQLVVEQVEKVIKEKAHEKISPAKLQEILLVSQCPHKALKSLKKEIEKINDKSLKTLQK